MDILINWADLELAKYFDSEKNKCVCPSCKGDLKNNSIAMIAVKYENGKPFKLERISCLNCYYTLKDRAME